MSLLSRIFGTKPEATENQIAAISLAVVAFNGYFRIDLLYYPGGLDQG